MKRKTKLIAVFIAASALTSVAQAQTNAKDTTTVKKFEPSGKVGGKIYADFHGVSTQYVDASGKTQNESYSAFEVTRAYFGYDYHFSKTLSGNVKLDVGKDANLIAYTAYLKNAALTWKATKSLEVDFGLHDTYQFHPQEGFWGKRYLYNSFQDKYHFGSSADAGLILKYKFNKIAKIDVAVLNGDGYKSAQDINGQYQYAGGLTLTPTKGLYIRGYYDIYSIATTDSGAMASKSTIATFAGYKTKKFSIGAEYNMQTNNKDLKDHNLSGFSVYGEFWATKKIGVFARYDNLTSNKINSSDKDVWNVAGDGSAIIGGVEYKAAKSTFVSLNYQGWTGEASGSKPINSIYLSLQYAF